MDEKQEKWYATVHQHYPWLVEDPNYIHRGNPQWAEHDTLGFRNARVPERAEILVTGDSQTYGQGIPQAASWPSVLGQRLKCQVYNAGMDAWGGMQYGLAVEELLSLRPRQVLIAVYSGNDLYESYVDARLTRSPLARSWLPERFSSAPWIETSARKAKAARVRALVSEGLTRAQALRVCSLEGVTDCNYVQIQESRLYLEDDFRFRLQDPAESAVEAGWAVAEAMFRHVADMAVVCRFALSVVFVPTREYVVFSRLSDVREISSRDSLCRLGETEAGTLARLTEHCRSLGIRTLDLTPALARCAGEAIYPQLSDNGHPTSLGCQVIADCLADELLRTASEAVPNLYPLS